MSGFRWAGSSVAEVLHRFVDRGGAARARAWTPEAFWAGADAIIHDLAPRNRELLARRDELQSRIDDCHRAHPGRPRPGGLHRVPARDRLPARRARRRSGDHRRRRRRGRPHRRPAAGRAAAQRALRHQRRQRPLGLAVRRALRHRRRLRARATSRPGDGYNKVRGDEVIARGRAFLDEHFPLASGSHADATSYAVDDEGLAVTRQGRRGPARRPRPARRPPRRRRARPRRCCWSTTACTSRSRSTPRTPIGSHRRRRRQGPAAGVRGLHDHGPRGLRRRRRRRGQGARLPQLAAARWRAPSPRRSPRTARPSPGR